ncbi:MAG: hypothetical protein MSH40_05575 [Christensenella sp.]|nr:hypothetical protein [Christensenella sp.]
MSKKFKDYDPNLDLNLDETPQKSKKVRLRDKTDYKKAKANIEKNTVLAASIMYKIFGVIGLAIFIGLLLYSISFLPRFGGLDNPSVNEIVNEYIENGYKNTGAENVVTALILDYRGFDTLGETFVLFTAVLAVLILLKEISPKKRIDTYKLQNDIIFSSIAKLIIPLIFLYALYVLFNGESSPGGGFSGGTIMGVGLMVYSMAFGEEKAHKLFNETTFKVVTSVALCCYVGVKCYAFFTQLKAAEALGGYIMLIMDLCVGAVVASTMYSFYSLFTKGEI